GVGEPEAALFRVRGPGQPLGDPEGVDRFGRVAAGDFPHPRTYPRTLPGVRKRLLENLFGPRKPARNESRTPTWAVTLGNGTARPNRTRIFPGTAREKEPFPLCRSPMS